MAVVAWVVDLADPGAERMPQGTETAIEGIQLPRLAVAPGRDPVPLVLAFVAGDAGGG